MGLPRPTGVGEALAGAGDVTDHETAVQSNESETARLNRAP